MCVFTIVLLYIHGDSDINSLNNVQLYIIARLFILVVCILLQETGNLMINKVYIT